MGEAFCAGTTAQSTKGTGKTVKLTAEGNLLTRMGIYMKVNGWTIKLMVTGNTKTLMEGPIKATGNSTDKMAMELSSGPKGPPIKGITKTAKNTEKESLSGLMEVNSPESFLTTLLMDSAIMRGAMDESIQGIGPKTERTEAGSLSGLMENNMRGTISKT